MKKNAKTVILVVILCALVLGYYTYLSNKHAKERQDYKLTQTQELLTYDLKNDYPHSPRDVVKLYNRMLSCIYEKKLSGKDLDKMVDQMRRLYSDKLLNDSENTKEKQLAALEKELETHKKEDYKITNCILSEASQVEYGNVGEDKCAVVDATYTIREKNDFNKSSQSYILVQDEDKNWKILGWEDTKKESNTEKNETTKE